MPSDESIRAPIHGRETLYELPFIASCLANEAVEKPNHLGYSSS